MIRWRQALVLGLAGGSLLWLLGFPTVAAPLIMSGVWAAWVLHLSLWTYLRGYGTDER
jgi:hypothetical protein